MKIIVINGVNLNMLGTREPEVYGSATLEKINSQVSDFACESGVEIEFFQSNFEGEIVERIHAANGNYDGIIINPAAFTHYSIAIRDALASLNIPAVEVHISNVHKREGFREHSVTAGACIGQVSGFGAFGYCMAILALKEASNGIHS